MKMCNSVDDMWEYFKQILLTGMNEFIPRNKYSSKNSKKKFQPFTSELKNIIHKNTVFENNQFQLKISRYLKNIKRVQNHVKQEMVKLTQQEQHRISLECKKIQKVLAVYK